MQAKQTILERFSGLSPTLQAAARYVVDHPNEVVIASMRSLADKAGIQPATLVRLAQQLGYSGWPELKLAFAEDLGLRAPGAGAASAASEPRDASAGAPAHDLLDAVFAAQRRNLEQTAARSSQALRAAAQVLQQAKTVHVAGFRGSFPIAYSLVYGYRLFRNSVHLIDGQSGGLTMQLRPIEAGDAVVSISFAPYSRESAQVAEAARVAGAKIVALTDSSTSPLALVADVPVLFSTQSPASFASACAAVALTEALLALLLDAAGEGGRRQLDRAARDLFDRGADLEPPAARRVGNGAD